VAVVDPSNHFFSFTFRIFAVAGHGAFRSGYAVTCRIADDAANEWGIIGGAAIWLSRAVRKTGSCAFLQRTAANRSP
jgi:hypothetical protein